MKPALWCLPVLLACSPTPPPAVAPKLSAIQQDIFLLSCATASCHSSKTLAGNLDLSTAAVSYAQLVGVAAENVGAVDDKLLRVKPGDPDASFLVLKLHDKLSVSYGVRMPWGNPDGLDASDVAAIETWVRNGALND